MSQLLSVGRELLDSVFFQDCTSLFAILLT
jgi:hypothetical protein